MTNKLTTTERRFIQLVRDIKDHPNREELLRLMDEQVADDTYYVNA